MKTFHFTKTYFNKNIFDRDEVRVDITETPSINIHEEEYSLRVSARYEEQQTIHKRYAIEHHLGQEKHNFPHLQFKFHAENIGQFTLRIDVETEEEYKKAILGFIYKIKGVLESLEGVCKGITTEVLVLSLVNELADEGDFLTNKIRQGVIKYGIEQPDSKNEALGIERLKENPLLLEFIGKENASLIEKTTK